MKAPERRRILRGPIVHGRIVHDPGRLNLRKAARAVVVTPLLFAFAIEILDDPPLALFVAFGSFAALIFADFGGRLPRRFLSYAGLVMVGGLLVAIGTVLSQTTAAATVVMLVVGFAAVLVAALGGPWAAGQQAATLAFVLAVMVPAPSGQLAGRELGWLLGVGVAGVAAILLWPAKPRIATRRSAAATAATLAVLIRRLADATESAEATTQDGARAEVANAIARLRADGLDSVYRPAGTARFDRALAGVVVGLLRCDRFAALLTPDSVSAERAHTVATSAAAALDAASAALSGDPHATLDLRPLAVARRAEEDAIVRWTEDTLARGVDATEVVEHLHSTFALRGFSVATAAVAENAAELVGRSVEVGDLDLTDLPELDRARVRHFAPRVLRANLDLRSVRFRNALRSAVGLAAAVLVAKLFALDHAFWVVLGTLSVLRSNVLGTGVSALEALAGTAIGFAIATGVMNTIGTDSAVLWILLPVTVFLSGYTPGAVHFVVGQASFTVFVVVLFNLLVPEGWRTGLVRFEDIAIGVSVSFLAGSVLWPRGVRTAAREAFATLLRATGTHLQVAVAALRDEADAATVAGARDRALAARTRANAAFEELAHQTVNERPSDTVWTTLLAAANKTRLVSELFTVATPNSPRAEQDPVTRVLVDEAHAVNARFAGDADRIEGGADRVVSVPTFVESIPHAHEAFAGCFAREAGDRPAIASTLRLAWAQQWLELVDDALGTIDEPVVRIGALAHRPWWR